MYTLELIHTAEMLIRDVIGFDKVNKNTKILVITDAARLNIGKTFALVCRGLGAETVLTIMPMTGEHGNEPPAVVAAAMKAADVVFAPTTHAITHTNARRNASAAGAKVFILRGITEDIMMSGAMTVDFKKLKERTARLAKVLNDADNIRVTSALGTDVNFSIKGRKTFTLDGYFREEVGFAGFPPGECPTSPVEGTTNGTIVFDYSMDSFGRLSQPLIFTVKDGCVVSVSGASEHVLKLEKYFKEDENNRNIAEFAIGTNPNSRLTGNLAEDKKLMGTVHFAIGDSMSLLGKVDASIHLDGLMLKPTVIADEKTVLVDNGKLMIA